MNRLAFIFHNLADVILPWMDCYSQVKIKFLDKHFNEHYKPQDVVLTRGGIPADWASEARNIGYVDFGIHTQYYDCVEVCRYVKDVLDLPSADELSLDDRYYRLLVTSPRISRIYMVGDTLDVKHVSRLTELHLKYVMPAGNISALLNGQGAPFINLRVLNITSPYVYYEKIRLRNLPSLRELDITGYDIEDLDLPNLTYAAFDKCILPEFVELPRLHGLILVKTDIYSACLSGLRALYCRKSLVESAHIPELKILILMKSEFISAVPTGLERLAIEASICSDIGYLRPIYLVADKKEIIESIGKYAQYLHIVGSAPTNISDYKCVHITSCPEAPGIRYASTYEILDAWFYSQFTNQPII
jgi:hypothetical protein